MLPNKIGNYGRAYACKDNFLLVFGSTNQVFHLMFSVIFSIFYDLTYSLRRWLWQKPPLMRHIGRQPDTLNSEQ